METPRTDHLSSNDYDHVYEPAEDTFLLLDALESDLCFLDKLQPCTCLEIGSGSGVIITALSKRLCSTFCVATDINLHACEATKQTNICNKSRLFDVINCSLANAFRSHSVDLIVFNPPYVVTPDYEMETKNSELTASWAGGKQGRQVIDNLLRTLGDLLSLSGVLYLLLLQDNKPQEVKRELLRIGFHSEIIMERHIPGERLYILKAIRNS